MVEYPFLPRIVLPLAKVSHVAFDFLRGEGHEVPGDAVLAIGHDHPRVEPGVFLVLPRQGHEFMRLVDHAGGCLERGDDAFLVINGAVIFVTGLALAAALAHQRGIGVGRAPLALVGWALVVTFFARIGLRAGLPIEFGQDLGACIFHDGVPGGIGAHEAGIHVQLGAFN